MNNSIQIIGIIGTGTMGASLAAFIASSNHKVVLLDIPSKNIDKNSQIKEHIANLQYKKPPAFTSNIKIRNITVGNLDEDLYLLKECDLIIEAITEKLEAKQELYQKIIPYLKSTTIFTSNTSTIPLTILIQQFDESLKSRFFITHFFNPPRYLELVELVTLSSSNINLIKKLVNFLETYLGKTVILCKDTPAFIANRIGCFLLELAVRSAIKIKLDLNIIDHLFNQIFQLPKTGVFGLYDLIGLDVMKLISNSLKIYLPKSDQYNQICNDSNIIDQMLNLNLLGKKTGSGFYLYKKNTDLTAAKQIINFDNYEFEDPKIELGNYKAENSINNLFDKDNVISNYFLDVLVKFYIYIFNLIPNTIDDLVKIDLCMKLGFGWKLGPIELLKTFDTKFLVNRANQLQIDIPKSFTKFITSGIQNYILPKFDISKEQIIFANDSSNLYIYKSQIIFEIATKQQILTLEIFHQLHQALDYAEKLQKPLFLYSASFSSGADLKYIANCIINKNYFDLDNFLKIGQLTMKRLKSSLVPVVAVAKGVALGGGCELLLHSDYIFAHSELRAGLVESSLGLIPSFGGIKEIFLRSNSNINKLINNIQIILNGYRSDSADNFQLQFSLENIHITMNKHSLLDYAITNYSVETKPLTVRQIIVPKFDIAKEYDQNSLTPHQNDIINLMQKIIDSSVINENDLFNFEREYFLKFASKTKTINLLRKFL